MIMMIIFAILGFISGLCSLMIDDDGVSFLFFVASMICVFGVVVGVIVCV